MMDDLKQFLSSDVCLTCDGCCRFDRAGSEWRPKVGDEETTLIEAAMLDVDAGPMSEQPLVASGGYLRDQECHGLFTCVFFNSDDSTCAVYQARPFECRLYPFVLTRKEDQFGISVHLACPFVQTHMDSPAYADYVAYLKAYIAREDVTDFLHQNPHLFGCYQGHQDELLWLFGL